MVDWKSTFNKVAGLDCMRLHWCSCRSGKGFVSTNDDQGFPLF